jgi:serine/threonine-protein kinase
MDWVEGPTLDEIISKDGHLSAQRAVPIFCQIASALAVAHQKNVIHRDLKPLNICLITQPHGTELAMIVDFGLAKFVAGDTPERNLTRPGQVCGSPLYMSPEQVQSKPLDGRSDIYSFGCLMYETLTGNPPFVGDTTFDTMNKHVEEEVPRFASCLSISPKLEAIVMGSMEKDPQRRYQKADELYKDLQSVMVCSVDKPRISRAWTAALLLLLVALVVTVVCQVH